MEVKGWIYLPDPVTHSRKEEEDPFKDLLSLPFPLYPVVVVAKKRLGEEKTPFFPLFLVLCVCPVVTFTPFPFPPTWAKVEKENSSITYIDQPATFKYISGQHFS